MSTCSSLCFTSWHHFSTTNLFQYRRHGSHVCRALSFLESPPSLTQRHNNKRCKSFPDKTEKQQNTFQHMSIFRALSCQSAGLVSNITEEPVVAVTAHYIKLERGERRHRFVLKILRCDATRRFQTINTTTTSTCFRTQQKTLQRTTKRNDGALMSLIIDLSLTFFSFQ